MKLAVVLSLPFRVLQRHPIAVLCVVVMSASVGGHAGDLPLYRATHTYAVTNGHLRAFNNAGDVVATGYTPVDPNQTTAFLLRNGVTYDLFTQPGTNQVIDLLASDITQTNGDGSVSVLGWIDQDGLIRRGIILNVNASGQVASSQLLPYYVEPDGSAFVGQTNGIAPTAMNDSGLVVGPRGLGGIVRWFPPYDTTPGDSFFGYGRPYNPIGIDAQSRVLVSGWGFDVGGPLERSSAAVDTSGAVTEVPYLYYTNAYQLTFGNAIHGGYVAGYGYAPDYDPVYPKRALVWKIGDAASTRLPDPVVAGYTVRESQATSVNSNGDVVGWVNLSYGTVTSGFQGRFPMLWKRAGGTYTPYLLYQLLIMENGPSATTPDYGHGNYFNGNILINDAGQIAYAYQPQSFSGYVPDQLTVLDPLTNGVVEVATQYPYVIEEDGQVAVTVSLTRAVGYTSPVTVNFATSNDTAQAGVQYVATNGVVSWGTGESGPKNITIGLVDDVIWSGYSTDFYLNLSGATGAELHPLNFAQVYINEGVQMVSFVNGTNDGSFSTPYAVAQGYDHVLLTLNRTGPGDGMMVISNLTTFDGTALAGTHYVANTQDVSWAAGEVGNKYVTINLLSGSLGGAPKYFGVQGTAYLIDPTNSTPILGVYGYVSIEPTNQLDQPSLKTSASYVLGANFGFDFSGVLGATFAIEHSTNLIDWSEIAVETDTNLFEHFTLPLITGTGAHFYRTKFK